MTDYTKLVKALRETATFTKFDDLLSKREQKLESLAFDAADAIEELQQIANHYEQTAKDYWKEACEYKAQLPKRGEWKKISNRDDGTADYECFACHGIIIDVPNDDERPLVSYCPMCWARMRNYERIYRTV